MDRSALAQWRQTLGYTQKQLADALGVKQNTIARWEGGHKPIGNPVMLRLALERLRDQRQADITALSAATKCSPADRMQPQSPALPPEK